MPSSLERLQALRSEPSALDRLQAARSSQDQDQGADDDSWGHVVAEFIGREIGSVAGTFGGAAFGGGTALLNAARNLDPMALLRAVPETIQGGIAGELAGREEGKRQGGELYDQLSQSLDWQSPIRIPRQAPPASGGFQGGVQLPRGE